MTQSLLPLLLWAACAGLLYILDRKLELDFTWRAPLSLVLGLGIGMLFPQSCDLLLIPGLFYVQVLTVLTLPLVLCSTAGAWIQLKALELCGTAFENPKVRRVPLFLVLNVLLATLLALVASDLAGLGTGFCCESLLQGSSPVTWALAVPACIIPVVRALRSTDSDHAQSPRQKITLALHRTFTAMVHLVPFAILSLAVGMQGLQSLLPPVAVLALTVLLCGIHCFPVQGLLLWLVAGVSPLRFFSAILPALRAAFLTQSGKQSMPIATAILTRQLDVPEDISHMVGNLGPRIAMAGCAGIWPVCLAVFALHATGQGWGMGQCLLLISATVIISVVTMDVPGTSMITPVVLFLVMGLPLQLMVLLLSVSGLADMARTPTNVASAASAGLLAWGRKGPDR